jgi:acyl carrier protein
MSTSDDSIRHQIIEYVLANHMSPYDKATMPLDESLVELGVLDSYGVIEIVSFLEATWSITIADSEITRETMGSINKMVSLIRSKL